MNVLHVARYGSVRGGAETYVAAIAAGQRAGGDQVALAYGMEPDLDRPEVRDGVQVGALVEPRLDPPDDGRRALQAAIERVAPDVVHVHVPDVPWVAAACAEIAPTLLAVHDHVLDCPAGTRYWTAWKRRCAIVPGPWCLAYNLTAHCGSMRANATLRPYRRWRTGRDAARGLHVQAFSESVAWYLGRAGLDRTRVGVTPYPVPPLADPVAPVERDERPVIFASGRHNKEKGFHELIESLFSVGTRSHLVIAGDGHERDALEERAIKGPRGHRVTFPGWLPAGAHAGWIERAAVVAVPSVWPEPFGIVGLEAMARGRAVVAFDVGGVREWLADGQTGVLVRAGDVAAFGRALDRLLVEPDEARRMGQAGRSRVEAEFSLVAHLDTLRALYETVRRDREKAA